MQLKLTGLGSVVIADGDGPIGGHASQRRALALLVLVSSAGDRGIARDKLIGMLWPDATDERARHAFAQTLYRVRQACGNDAVAGADILRLDRSRVGYDVAEFEAAVARGNAQAAVDLYRGPFLDGFYLSGAVEFEQWVEAERARLAAVYRQVLEHLAMAATTSGAPALALAWWRRLAAEDPVNTRVAVRLLEAFDAAGDTAGAVQYARVHEHLLREEMGVEPPPEFARALDRIRQRNGEARALGASAERAAHPESIAQPREDDAHVSHPFEHTSQTWRVTIPRRAARIAAAAGLVVFAGAALAYARLEADWRSDVPSVAVGNIADHTRDDTIAAARVLPELLTTNLGRLSGLNVVHRSRLFELIADPHDSAPDAASLARAAMRADVDQLVDGAVFRRADGAFRLDLRLLDIPSGNVRAAATVEAGDVFALADSATTHIAARFGLAVTPALRVSDVTTSSLTAYRFYEEGLRALRNRDRSARRLFDAALAQDTAFAMAAYGAYRASEDDTQLYRALRLSGRVTDRERLLIRSSWANRINHPSRVAIAETLATRYPASPESHLELAGALLWSGDFAGARRAARQAYAMDSLSISSDAARCAACEALEHIASAWMLEDSMAAAERIARDWIARDPRAAPPWHIVRIVLAWRDSAGALEAYERERALSPGPLDDFPWEAELAIRHGNFAKAERLLQPLAESGPDHRRVDALWWMIISRRHEGRLAEALALALSMRRLDAGGGGSAPLHAQVLFELGRFREAASIFDSAAIIARTHREPSARARHEGWSLLHKAEALAAAGDTAEVRRLADRLARTGAQSGYGRDPLLHHHLRGLNLRHGGRVEESIAAFRSAMWSPSSGYTRINLELGRALIDAGRPAEAVPVLRAGLRSGLQASSLYATHTDFHALMARAFAAMREPDSSRLHAAWVERALVRADDAVKRHFASVLPR